MPSRSHFRDDVVTRRSRLASRPQPLEPPRQLDVLHQGDVGVAAEGVEGGARDEDALVSRARSRSTGSAGS